MWPIRQAIVVSGGGDGSGSSKSITPSPVPAAIAVVASARGRMLHDPGTGSHRYCSSVSESSRLRKMLQWKPSCSSSSFVQLISMAVTVEVIEDRFGPCSARLWLRCSTTIRRS